MVLARREWIEEERRKALDRGLHQFTMEHVPFLSEEFALMVRKGQWVVLPYLAAKDLLGIKLSLPGVKEGRDRRPRWLGNYSYSNLKI